MRKEICSVGEKVFAVTKSHPRANIFDITEYIRVAEMFWERADGRGYTHGPTRTPPGCFASTDANEAEDVRAQMSHAAFDAYRDGINRRQAGAYHDGQAAAMDVVYKRSRN